ncbi:hypothetical protein F5H01DRAFT_345941 [Linnemannia elongata]|nr:hypothetical protein F5H01DRAFT_345941 [Linnemannia elongata]
MAIVVVAAIAVVAMVAEMTLEAVVTVDAVMVAEVFPPTWSCGISISIVLNWIEASALDTVRFLEVTFARSSSLAASSSRMNRDWAELGVELEMTDVFPRLKVAIVQ